MTDDFSLSTEEAARAGAPRGADGPRGTRGAGRPGSTQDVTGEALELDVGGQLDGRHARARSPGAGAAQGHGGPARHGRQSPPPAVRREAGARACLGLNAARGREAAAATGQAAALGRPARRDRLTRPPQFPLVSLGF